MSLRTWMQRFVTCGALAWGIGGVGASPGQAQPPEPPSIDAPATGVVPQLPETDVVAEPPPPNFQPNFNPFNQPRTVLNSNVFSLNPVEGYAATSSNVGSFVNIPTMSYPGSVNTITRDLLNDQQVISTQDLLRNISGATYGFGNGGDGVQRPDQFLLRGLEMTAQNFRKNGFLDPTNTPRDYSNVERVDILKGPAAVVYGSSQPAGTFNVITKKALQDRFAVATTQFGSFGFQRYQYDVNTMNGSGDVLFRVNGAYQESDSFRDFGFNQRTFVSPTMTLLLSERTFVTIEAEFNNDRRLYDTGVTAINGDPRALPQERFLGDPNDFLKFRDNRGTIALTHLINDDWQFYIGGTTQFADAPIQSTVPGFTPGTTNAQGFYTHPGGADLMRRRSVGGQHTYNHAIIANLSGKFDGPLFRHNTLVGTEQDWLMRKAQFQSSNAGNGDSPLLIDPTSFGPFPGTTTTSVDFDFSGNYQRRHGFYFQDLIDLTDRLHVLTGARYDILYQNVDLNATATIPGLGTFPIAGGPTNSSGSYYHITPRVGLIYDLVPDDLMLYGLYTTAFNPIDGQGSISTPVPGASFAPDRAYTYEGGFKARLRENLFLTASGFYIDRQNVAVPFVSQDANQNLLFLFATGDQVSRGAELNLYGQWTDRLSTIANYAYTDASQFVPPAAMAGGSDLNGRILGVPFNTANIWTRYNFIQDRRKTFGAGLGYSYIGQRRGDYGGFLGSPLVLSDYDRWDAALYGNVGRWFANLYIENVFDRRYEIGSINQYQIIPGAPINARFMAGVTF